ncbi:MAG: hypothetical protein Ct9H90mP7_5620 [Candidatus Neomarinimicrobiota bacterium]|nr:MAG: hypothetical protein Ct9H90mP7_5620 [Candidatus Neomarinimicrobiota bacterium]
MVIFWSQLEIKDLLAYGKLPELKELNKYLGRKLVISDL